MKPILVIKGDDDCLRYFIEGDESDPGFSLRVNRSWADDQVNRGKAYYVKDVQCTPTSIYEVLFPPRSFIATKRGG